MSIADVDPAAGAAGPVVLAGFRAAVARTPDAPAITAADGTVLRYAELAAAADRVAARMRVEGVRRGVPVAVLLERDPAVVVAVLAVWVAGGVLVPLDPAAPVERLRAASADAGVQVTLTRPGTPDLLAGPRVCVDEALAEPPTPLAPDPGLTPSDAAYIMFTSGSTGRPKGVVVDHRGLANRLWWAQSRHRLGAADAVLHKTPVSFDPWLWEVLWPLLAGARVVIAAPGAQRDPQVLADTIERHAATVVHFAPSTLEAFLAGTAADCRSLRLVVVSGEALGGATVRRLQGRCPAATVENLYGPAEAAIDVTAWSCPAGTDPAVPVPIGTPITGTRAYVLDDELRSVVEGELYLSGPGVGWGYVGRPGLTAERFLPDPFAAVPGTRMYRTGDRARRRADGVLEFAGRVDDQVKIRGVRVEPGEVRAALLAHPGVREAAVTATRDAGGRTALVGHVVSVERGISPAELRAHLATRLPDEFLPTRFRLLEKLPLTPNGKVDRAALAATGLPQDEVAPATFGSEAERSVAAVWAEVLGRAPSHPEDNFFELGGHSLAAVDVVALIRERLGADVGVGTLFERPTVAGFALAVVAAPARRAEPGIRPSGSPGPFPLSFAQRRLWFLYRFDESSPEYNVPVTLRLRGPLAAGQLRRALTALTARHEVLRTVYPAPDGEPQQIVLPPGEVPLPLDDVRAAPEHREAALREAVTGEMLEPFDLARGPVLRARLLRAAPDDHVLAVTVHHVAVDATTVGLLIDELAELYEAGCQGRPAELPELTLSYADYAVWQRRAARSTQVRRGLEYWRRTLEDAPQVELPLDRSRPRVPTAAGAVHRFVLPDEDVAALRDLAARYGVTVNMAGLAALAVLLGRNGEQPEVTVGSPSTVRPEAGLQGVAGCFLNMLVLRVGLAGGPTVAELLHRVRGVVAGALEHADVPFEVVVDELITQRDMSTTPLFQVVWSHQLAAAPRRRLHDVEAAPFAPEQRTATYDLSLAVVETPDTLHGVWEYRTDLFDAATVRELHERFTHLLRQFAAAPGERLSRLSPLPPAERHRLLHEWNDTTLTLSGVGGCLHELFEEQVDRTPERPAVEQGGSVISYAELDRRANAVAHRLLAAGVGAAAVVGICAERSLAALAAVLGVLKTGAAFLPLEPGHPLPRLAATVADARALAVLAPQSRLPALERLGVPLLALEGAAGRDDRPGVRVRDDATAYVMFTSGSTGRPKGVVVEHRGVVNRLLWGQREHPLGAADAVLVTAPMGFDISVSEYAWPLLVGARVVLAPPGPQRSPEEIVAAVRRHGATVVDLVSGMVDGFIEHGLRSGGGLPGLRLVLAGAETLSPATVARFRAATEAELVNLYGVTEVSIDSLFRRCGPDDAMQAPVPIGRPIANTTMYLLDDDLEPVPRGAVGEICLGGIGVARGYAGRAAETAVAFVPDPFSAVPGARLYRTGDLGRYRADGAAEFLGRRDDQVKIRGNRVEPGEAEAALATLPGVDRAVVIVREDVRGQPRLVGYVTAADGDRPPEPAVLRVALGALLPVYLVPSAIVVLAGLPLTENGKLDRTALPEPGAPGARAWVPTPPRTPAEAVLARIWADVLGLVHVGVHDDFFELGGDSIAGIRVVSRARAAGLRLTPAQVFEHPTVAALAAAEGTAPPVAPEQGLVTGDLPLTPVQCSVLGSPSTGADGHVQAYAVALPDGTAEGAVRAALELVLAHHDVLRAVFRYDGTAWRCEIGPLAGPPPLTVEDLGEVPARGLVPALRPVAGVAAAGIRLGGPVVRAVLVRFADAPPHLLVVAHHAVVDVVSWDVLIQDVRTAAERWPEQAVLPPKTTSYREWARRLEDYAASPASRAEAAYWASGPPSEPLPLDHVTGEDTEELARTVTVELDERRTAALLGGLLARRYAAEPLDALLIAATAAITDLTGAATARIDLEGQGRTPGFADVDLSRTVGWFTTIHPVYLPRPTGDLAVDLRAIREERARPPRGGLPYGVARYLGDDPLLRSRLEAEPPGLLFNFVSGGRPPGEVSDTASGQVGGGALPVLFAAAGMRTHPLDVVGEAGNGRLRLHWRYGPGRFREQTVRALAQACLGQLEGVVDRALQLEREGRVPPARFPAARLGEDALDRLLAERPDIEDVYPLTPLQQGLLFHSLYEGGSAYVEQSSFVLDGELSVPALHRAIARLVRHHPALRTAIAWQDLPEPHQVVHSGVTSPLRVIEAAGDPGRVLADVMAAEREDGFDLARPPLVRFTLLRAPGGDRAHLVLTGHHVVLDGWSDTLLLRDLWDGYVAEAADAAPLEWPELPPFREYVRWAAEQDLSEADEFWTGLLGDLRRPTLLAPLAAPTGPEDGPPVLTRRLPAEVSAAAETFCRDHRLTLSALAYGAWAVHLAELSGSSDVSFGITVSGRSAPLQGMEELVGPLSTTLPLRIAVPRSGDRVEFLRQLHGLVLDVSRHEHSPLSRVRRLSAVPPGQPLFDSTCVVQNFPVLLERSASDRLRITRGPSAARNSFAVSLEILPTTPLTLRAQFDPAKVDRPFVERLVEGVGDAVGRLADAAADPWPRSTKNRRA